MEIEEALTAYLLAHTGLAALVGTKIYWHEAPQGTALPFVIGQNVSDVKNPIHGGISTLENPNHQFTAYAATKKSAKAIAKQIKAALLGYSGTLSGVQIHNIQLLNELSTLEKSADGTTKVYATDLEFQVFYKKE